MKRQIRRSAFETNSSSNHTLSITKKDIDQLYINDKLAKLVDNNDILNLPTTKVQDIINIAWKNPLVLHEINLRTKLDLLMYSAIGDNSAKNFLIVTNKLVSLLEKFGFVVNINHENLIEACDYSYIDDGLFYLVSSILYNEQEILNFLFSDESYYTCWCDEGCMGPSKEVEEIENKMYGREDVIYINERL